MVKSKFSFVKNQQTILRGVHTISHSYQQWMRVLNYLNCLNLRHYSVLSSVPDFGHSDSCIVVSHCYINLYFPDTNLPVWKFIFLTWNNQRRNLASSFKINLKYEVPKTWGSSFLRDKSSYLDKWVTENRKMIF